MGYIDTATARLIGVGDCDGAPVGRSSFLRRQRCRCGQVYFYPRGSGTHWENPSYSKDYPTIPFIPTSWGGADAANKSSTPYGANVTAGVMTTSSGPRSLKQGDKEREQGLEISPLCDRNTVNVAKCQVLLMRQ